MKRPLVSILTPCYNGELYVGRCVEKLLEQTYDNVELVIVNDGSTDKTEEIILSFAGKYKERGYKLVYVKQENLGVGGAINTALKNMSGEYFALCDSDNFYTCDYINKKVEFFENNPQFSIVRCNGYFVNEKAIDVPIRKVASYSAELFKEDMFENCLFLKNFHFGGAMFRTEDFDKINPEREIYPSRHGQNWQILLPMFYHYKAGYIDIPMFYFVYRKGSIYNSVLFQEVSKQYQQVDEHRNILINTLKRIEMSDEERENYIYLLNITYAQRRLAIAYRYKDILKFEEEYRFLKDNNALRRIDKTRYYRVKNKLYDFIMNVIEKVKGFISKIKKYFTKENKYKKGKENANN